MNIIQSNWNKDRAFESISMNYLKNKTSLFKDSSFNVLEFVDDLPRQLQGIDLIADIPFQSAITKKTIHRLQNVDVKSIAANIPTFSFEISGNVSTNQIGWLINPAMKTDYYLLIYHQLFNNSSDYRTNKENMSVDDICKTQSILIKKLRILSIIKDETGLDERGLQQVAERIREKTKDYPNEIHRFKINCGEIVEKRKDERTNITITISKHLREQPINVIIRKDLLIKNAKKTWNFVETSKIKQYS